MALSERITHIDRFGVPCSGVRQLLKEAAKPKWTRCKLRGSDTLTNPSPSGTPCPIQTTDKTRDATAAHISIHKRCGLVDFGIYICGRR
ncbi:hypothetical protein BC936DRAFT_143648 [Jimgerdemannia flammicorona]|uniref:Uncharacterized protein n=1 Tax=Jimgerdemannia flammicorona TaxID=994334 RepID=A0A433DDJ1_9FUNG|nr:hypothetical protein BC936DRAFT_143648 [Jimgerdemannia flammicorona]